MIPSREECYHVLSMDQPPHQQPLRYQNRLQSWHKPSQYADGPFQHYQNQLHRLGDLQVKQASIVRNFPDIEVKSEEDFSNQFGVSGNNRRTMDVCGFTPVSGLHSDYDSFSRPRQGYIDPRISNQPTTSLPPFSANYYYSRCQTQTPNEVTGKTFLPLTNTYDQYQMEMVNWNSSTGCGQQLSTGTVLVPMQCEPGLNPVDDDTDIDGGSGNTTLIGIYRQNLAPSMPFDDHSNVVGVTAANMNERSKATSSVTSSVTSSMTSSSRCLRTDVVKTETRKIRLTPSTSRGKTRTREKYRSVYTEQQKLGLEAEFDRGTFIDARRKTDIAGAVGLSERQVKIWFQNRRAKDRKARREEAAVSSAMQEGDGDNCVSTSHGGFPVGASMFADCGANYDPQPIYDNNNYYQRIDNSIKQL